jgi:hypothetical protein
VGCTCWPGYPRRRCRQRACVKARWLRPRPARSPEALCHVSARSCSRLPRASASSANQPCGPY